MIKFLIIGLIVIVAAGWFALSNQETPSDDLKEGEMMNSGDETMMEKDDSAMMREDGAMMEKKEDGMMMENEDSMMQKGSYEAYSAEKLARAENGSVVLFFRASWCPTCRALDANIRANLDAIPAGVTILNVDYDASTVLKQKYGVTYQHTLVQVNTDGSLITKWSSSPTLGDVIAHIQ